MSFPAYAKTHRDQKWGIEEKSIVCRSFKGYMVKISSRMRISSPQPWALWNSWSFVRKAVAPVDEGGS